MVRLSVVTLSYNTSSITFDCVTSIIKSLESTSSALTYEVIVIDNKSSDSSVENLKKFQAHFVSEKGIFTFIENKKNVGYPAGNNQGWHMARGEYILFLNSDVMIDKVDFSSLLEYLDTNKEVGVLTVRVNLSRGGIDPASHRGFPTLWNSFCYFLKLEKILRSIPLINRVFGGYHQTYKNINEVHEIDSPTGAFYLTRYRILKEMGGFDEEYFMYGEDLDLSYRIKEKGYKVMYYPLFSVTHLKYSSGLGKQDEVARKKTKEHFFEAMKIFYKKHYQAHYPKVINAIVYWLIDLKKNLS
ncbi:MAG: glycosyltransferase family 2 protein [bacterium]|nr:glycosyltransferase family 2 protein [bacterium]